jgi:hypothetical protein
MIVVVTWTVKLQQMVGEVHKIKMILVVETVESPIHL